jgi:hypothetical protein
MAGPNGGYRRPTNPAPVSGPGQLSQRTDGGPQQVQADMSGMPYGENAEFNTMQSMAPMSASPSARSPRASTRSAKSAGGGMSATPLFAPTQRPDEPVTAGAPFGPGDGPMGINSNTGLTPGALASTVRKMVAADPTGDSMRLLAIVERLGW